MWLMEAGGKLPTCCTWNNQSITTHYTNSYLAFLAIGNRRLLPIQRVDHSGMHWYPLGDNLGENTIPGVYEWTAM